MQPVYIFSLPRSGSTLVQRVLASHPEIQTVSEPWILLPILLMDEEETTYTSYYHRLSYQGVRDLYGEFPDGRRGYLDSIESFVIDLYQQAVESDATYFVDKTPRYHLIANKVIETFRTGRFIFLWRSPLAVVASMIRTWGEGQWNLHRTKIDLYEGLESMVQAYSMHQDEVCAVNYEDLVCHEEPWFRLFRYLDLSFDRDLLSQFTDVNLSGTWGDPSGVHEYQKISSASLEKWKSVLRNPLRRWWAIRYLQWIGDERLQTMGYDGASLRQRLHDVPFSTDHLLSDSLRMPFGALRALVEPRLLVDKLRKLHDFEYVTEHK